MIHSHRHTLCPRSFLWLGGYFLIIICLFNLFFWYKGADFILSIIERKCTVHSIHKIKDCYDFTLKYDPNNEYNRYYFLKGSQIISQNYTTHCIKESFLYSKDQNGTSILLDTSLTNCYVNAIKSHIYLDYEYTQNMAQFIWACIGIFVFVNIAVLCLLTIFMLYRLLKNKERSLIKFIMNVCFEEKRNRQHDQKLSYEEDVMPIKYSAIKIALKNSSSQLTQTIIVNERVPGVVQFLSNLGIHVLLSFLALLGQIALFCFFLYIRSDLAAAVPFYMFLNILWISYEIRCLLSTRIILTEERLIISQRNFFFGSYLLYVYYNEIEYISYLEQNKYIVVELKPIPYNSLNALQKIYRSIHDRLWGHENYLYLSIGKHTYLLYESLFRQVDEMRKMLGAESMLFKEIEMEENEEELVP
mmetsp:Transcript_11140/g.16433  ORF Transcript_11140/g.16433 Transcript_11140/m.16433 type:complete len:416 (-) Transcript_11140:3283-4530(-)